MYDMDSSGGVTEPWSESPSPLGDEGSQHVRKGSTKRRRVVAAVAAMALFSGMCGLGWLVGVAAYGKAGASVVLPVASESQGLGSSDVVHDSELDESALRAEVREMRKLATKSSESVTDESGKGDAKKEKDKSTTSTKKKKSSEKNDSKQVEEKSTDVLSDESSDFAAVVEEPVEEPVVEEIAVEEPVVEEPAVEEPAVEEPAVEEPVEESVVEEPVVEESAKEPVAEEPVEDAPSGRHEFWFEALDYNDLAAQDAGYMVDCDNAWYCVHWWTNYGQQILSLEVGDVVHVNGRTAVIDYFYDLARDAYVEDVRADVGYDGMLLQTCYYAGSPTMRLCHGYYI